MSGFVTAVVCAAFDDAGDRAVLAARDVVARTGVRLPAVPRHRPHLTLAAARLHPGQVDALVDLLRPTGAAAAPVPLVMDHVGSFGRAGAVWLGPAPSAGLCTLQRSVHDAVAASPWPNPFGARTAPADWVAHCSLATRLDPDRLARARAAVEADLTPVVTTVTGLAVVLVGGSGDVGFVPLAGAQPASRTTQNG